MGIAKDAYDYKNSSIAQDKEAMEKVMKRVEENEKKGAGKEGEGGKKQQPDEGEGDEQTGDGEGGDDEQDKAARLVQGGYRAHTSRREAKGMNISSSDRWNDGLKQRKIAEAGKEQDEGKNDSNSRWKRTGVYAAQISDGQSKSKEQGPEMSEEQEMEKHAKNEKERQQIKEERAASKQMEAQYWLEIVDSKHRYGTNLKWYHQKWNEEDTEDNFFHWLDFGPGKDLDLEQCPRSRLEKEQITYLTGEQRKNYLVEVNDKGLLVWAKNGEVVNTTKYHRDAGPDEGIVKMTEEEVKEKEAKEKEKKKQRKLNGGEDPESDDDGSDSDESGEKQDEDQERKGVKGYSDKGGTAGAGKGLKQFKARINYYASPRAVMDRLLRETINKNTWLYVADMKNNLYVGIKQTGGFQHSSFLFGARVTSAGLLKADEGKLTSLSPLSGHYRAGTMHFKSFVRSLEERGVDMKSVNISKALITIGGIENYAAVTKKRKSLAETVKAKLNISKTSAQEKEEQDQKDVAAVKSDEGTQGHKTKEGEEGVNQGGKKDLFSGPLPGDGKKHEELTEEERTERGVALVQRAMDRGAQSTEQQAEDDGSDDEEEKEVKEIEAEKAKEKEK